jgi:hypothetical protein
LRQSAAPFFRFHIEHIRAKQHGGADRLDNLALACPDCNAHKGPNLTGIDPESDRRVRLFHPRIDRWEEHFAVEGPLITGSTPIGRATIALLRMNEPERVQMRLELERGAAL